MIKYLKLVFLLLVFNCASFSIEFIENSNYKNLQKSNFKNWKQIEILKSKPKKKIVVYGHLIIRKFHTSKHLKSTIQKKIFNKGFDGVWFNEIEKTNVYSTGIEVKHQNQKTHSYQRKRKLLIIKGNVYKYIK